MVCKEIKKHLKNKVNKLRSLSKKSGISEQIVGSILNGKRKMITEEYFDICDALGVQPNFFYHKKENE